MIRLTRSRTAANDPAEVFIDPKAIAAVCVHQGMTNVVLSGTDDLTYVVEESPQDVVLLRYAYFNRHRFKLAGDMAAEPEGVISVFMDGDEVVAEYYRGAT